MNLRVRKRFSRSAWHAAARSLSLWRRRNTTFTKEGIPLFPFPLFLTRRRGASEWAILKGSGQTSLLVPSIALWAYLVQAWEDQTGLLWASRECNRWRHRACLAILKDGADQDETGSIRPARKEEYKRAPSTITSPGASEWQAHCGGCYSKRGHDTVICGYSDTFPMGLNSQEP